MQKRHGQVAVFVGIVAVLAWWRWPRDEVTRTPASQGTAHTRAAAPAREPAPGDTPAAPSRVRRLTPGERLELGGQIQAAIARARIAARQARAGSAAAGDDVTIPLEEVSAPVQDALRAAIPLLAECYPASAGKTAAAHMTMASDPDLGTVIDTTEMTDGDGTPLAPAIDECLRDTIDSLALPSLGRRGMLQLQYTFRFD